MARTGDRVRLRFACGLYDRMLPLYTKEVVPDGIDLDFVISDAPRDLFDAMARGEGFDVAEMSSSEYVTRLDAGQCPFVALPVFPSRVFRHGFITVNRKAGIETPRDLEGRRVGIQMYTQTAAVWSRGILRHDYGVDLGNIQWVQGDTDKPGSHGAPDVMPLLKPARLELNTTDKSLDQLLQEGSIDALMSARTPMSLGVHPDVRRLFPDYRAVELDYYRRTGIFPIMHLIVIRRAAYDAHPFIAESLYRAFTAAKDRAVTRLRARGGTLPFMLPWMKAEVEEMTEIFGADPWPYGIAPNRTTLEALVAYLQDQHMIARRIPVEELFVLP